MKNHKNSGQLFTGGFDFFVVVVLKDVWDILHSYLSHSIHSVLSIQMSPPLPASPISSLQTIRFSFPLDPLPP